MTDWKRTLSRLVPAVPVALVLGSMLFSHSCANTSQAPTGGLKDTIPPRIVALSPDQMSVGVPAQGTRLVFTFDEYVTIKSASNIVLSPPQARPPKSRLRGKSVEITFEEDLLPDMTYTLDFIDAIADNNEGNIFPGFTYVFSTGDHIDSLMITGIVQDCNSLDPVKGVTVMLYKDHADSAVMLRRPFAVTKTDDWGFFCIRNIKDTLYRLYAVKDDNNNYMYDPSDKELIAFADSVIHPVTVVNDTLPEVQKLDMKDTLACLARKNEFELVLFRERPSRQMIMKQVRVSDRASYLTFNAPDAHIDSMWVRGVPANKLITQFNLERDSLEVWINEKSRLPDTLHMFVNYRKTDTSGRLSPYLEHLKVYYQSESGSKTASKSSSRNVKHEDTICVYKLEVDPKTVEQYGYRMEFDYPIVNEAFDSLKFKSINPRQQEEPAGYKVIPDSTNIRKFTVMPEGKLLPGYDYILKVPHRLFRDINGFYNDSTEVKFTLPVDEKLSTLNLVLSGVEQKYIVDLLNEKRDKVLRQYIIDSDRTLSFPYLDAGLYCIRITEDVNRNSIVDSGSLLEHRQPEKVKFFKVDGEILFKVMESAEIDQAINLAELFMN
jgi:hypothetical protein